MGRRQTDKPDFRSSDGHSGRSIGKNRKRGYAGKCRMTCPAGKESRNAGFILIAAQRQSTPSKPFGPYEPSEPFSLTTLLHNLRRQPRPFFNLRPKGATTTFGAKGPVKLKNPWAEGPSILRTLFMQPFYTTCRRQAATTLGAQPRQPSHRRCVQRASRAPFYKICGEAATTPL